MNEPVLVVCATNRIACVSSLRPAFLRRQVDTSGALDRRAGERYIYT